MKPEKHNLYQQLSDYICKNYNLNKESICQSINRNSQDSWYIKFWGDLKIRISDHESVNDFCLISIYVFEKDDMFFYSVDRETGITFPDLIEWINKEIADLLKMEEFPITENEYNLNW